MIRTRSRHLLSSFAFTIAALHGVTASAQEAGTPSPNVRGVIQSVSKIEIRSDLNLIVTSAKFRKGMAFKKDDELVTFDCARLQAERAAASASANAASIELRQKRTLLKHGAAGKGDVDLAGASVSKSTAEREVITQRMKECTIKAPFDGRVVATSINALEMPKPGEPLMVIIDDTNLQVELVMPSQWLSKLKPNSSFSFSVDETGETLSGKVERFGTEVDPVSQTIEVIGKIQTNSSSIRSGMSGSVIFDDIEKDGT
ncbi:MAG: efflux RND transporter periplasmic adaptor subunit [Rhizobiaceae bacterium]